MEMASSRRPLFHRSTEIVKKPRLSAESTFQRPELGRIHDREMGDRVRGGLQQHQELVNQYKIALAELTFNSKPIITNLTIIAGENLQSAKDIASIICSNILEVPSDQKLPSLYLLDSIVKNIGRDYIKYFAARLPEVFCKAYRLVDSSTHSSMRHLFGTWKGVFPPQSLQIIEKDLGLSAASNGPSSGSAASKADSQSQRQPHSIHVNPKYLEARQRVQQSNRPNGTETGETSVQPSDDVERPKRTNTSGTGRPWVDPSIKMNRPVREALREPNHQRQPSAGYGDYEFASGVSRPLRSALVEPSEKLIGQGYNKRWCDSGREVEESISSQRNGFDIKQGIPSYTATRPTSGNVPPLQNLARNSVATSRSWKNSDEEEYMWDDLGISVTDSATLSGTKRDVWSSDMEKKDYNPQELNSLHPTWQSPNETRFSFERKPSADALSFPQKDRGTSALARLSQQEVREPHQIGSSVPSLQQVGACSRPSVSLAGVSGLGFSKTVSGSSGSVGQLHTFPGQSPMHHHPPSPLSERDPRQNLAVKDHMRSRSFAHSDLREASLSGRPFMGLCDQIADDACHHQNSQPDLQGKSNGSSLLAAVMKSDLLSGSSASAKLAVEPSVTSLTSKTSTSSEGGIISPCPSHDSTTASLAQIKVEKSQLSLVPLPDLSPISNTSGQTSDVASTNPNSLSSLFSSLVAKGLISASKNESIAPIPVQSKIQPKELSNLEDTQTPAAISSGPQASSIDKPSGESTAMTSETSGQIAEADIDDLIGVEFKPRFLRKFHPSVIDRVLESLPYKCTVCGLQFKLHERLDKHSEWHAFRNSIPNSLSRPTRRWYSSSMDWIAGKAGFPFGYCSSSLTKAPSELGQDETMVPANESQCVCLLCGEVFEEVYNLERDEWMFRGAVYMSIPSMNNDGGSSSERGLQILRVHVHCVTDDSVHELGFISDVKVEKDV